MFLYNEPCHFCERHIHKTSSHINYLVLGRRLEGTEVCREGTEVCREGIRFDWLVMRGGSFVMTGPELQLFRRCGRAF